MPSSLSPLKSEAAIFIRQMEGGKVKLSFPIWPSDIKDLIEGADDLVVSALEPAGEKLAVQVQGSDLLLECVELQKGQTTRVPLSGIHDLHTSLLDVISDIEDRIEGEVQPA